MSKLNNFGRFNLHGGVTSRLQWSRMVARLATCRASGYSTQNVQFTYYPLGSA